MNHQYLKRILCAMILALTLLCGCTPKEVSCTAQEYPLERNGISLHLECLSSDSTEAGKQILLVHGVTYSSGEFDIDYEDYSLARFFVRNGYRVWMMDIAGYGRSEAVEDGFLPDSDYAAEDIASAVDLILAETGADTIDLLGWSWGTVTASRYAAAHPETLGKLVLYAPILSGIGEYDIEEPFHHNTWEHAASDFQMKEDGSFDEAVTDPAVIEVFCSVCWHYDGESSPNGGRRDICIAETEQLISLDEIKTPTLVICGDRDPYLNYEMVNDSLNHLPAGSALEIIPGGSHVIMLEKPYYHDFQKRLAAFLK